MAGLTPSGKALGEGLHHPLQLDGSGRLARSFGAEKIRQSVLIILGTERGTRVMRPDFGCALNTLVHAPNNRASANLARNYVMQALARWEPRIKVLQVNVENDNAGGRLLISAHYKINSTLEEDRVELPLILSP